MSLIINALLFLTTDKNTNEKKMTFTVVVLELDLGKVN